MIIWKKTKIKRRKCFGFIILWGPRCDRVLDWCHGFESAASWKPQFKQSPWPQLRDLLTWRRVNAHRFSLRCYLAILFPYGSPYFPVSVSPLPRWQAVDPFIGRPTLVMEFAGFVSSVDWWTRYYFDTYGNRDIRVTELW